MGQSSKVERQTAAKASSKPAPRSARTLRATIVESIRDAITDGIYAPGTPLAEVELAARFNVSRGPIREALIQLQHEYLVRSYPNRGTFVHTLNEQEFDEIEEMRALLEPLALEHAKANVTPEQIRNVERMLAEMLDLTRAGKYRELADRDFAFHCTVWDLSGRTFLAQNLRQIARPLFTFFKINWKKYRNSKLSMEEVIRHHNLLIEYLKGTTTLSAAVCYRPVLEGTDRDEKPLLLGSYTS
jgi:DNA-binding GntR family transcriptional regulator